MSYALDGGWHCPRVPEVYERRPDGRLVQWDYLAAQQTALEARLSILCAALAGHGGAVERAAWVRG